MYVQTGMKRIRCYVEADEAFTHFLCVRLRLEVSGSKLCSVLVRLSVK